MADALFLLFSVHWSFKLVDYLVNWLTCKSSISTEGLSDCPFVWEQINTGGYYNAEILVRGPDGLLTWLGSNLKTLLSNWLYYLCIHSLYNQWKFPLKIYSNTQSLNSRKWQKGLDRLHFIFMCTQRYRSTDHNIDFLHTQKWKLQLLS